AEHAVRERPRRQSVKPAPHDGTRSSVTSPDHANETHDYGQKEEVSSRDTTATSPDTDAVPKPRRRTDRIMEECSQYHPDRARSFDFQFLTEALGSQDPDFIWGLVSQLSTASTRFNDGEGLNFALSVIKNIHPRDAIEAMLGAQMATLHMSMMTYVDEFARLDRTLDPIKVNFRQEMADRAVNKLPRTFATLVGALKHYRTGGEQKLTVGQVSVSDGGQAIVGTVNQAPRDVLPEKTPNATPALTDARQTEMEIVGERKRKPVPQRRRHTDD
ncbi:MAG: hypothetical protein WA265_21235, partial [Rhodomicrobium sp.]